MTEESVRVARATRILLERTARTAGTEFFRALARGLAETLGTRFGIVGELVDPSAGLIRTLAVWRGDGYASDFHYPLSGTPCEKVKAGELCHYRSGVASLFPEDTMLAELGIQSYLGLAIVSPEGRPLGLVSALHDQETPPAADLASVLNLFADRAGVELLRMRFEAELARSEARYRQIVSNCIQGVWTVDAAGITTFVSTRMAAMLGYSEAEMIGRPLFDFMDAAARAQCERNLARWQEGIEENHESRLIHKQGHEVWTLMATSPRHEAGVYAGALTLVSDITGKHALEEREQETRRLESLGALAGGVAHDFNNLLVSMLANAESALGATDGTSVQPALVNIRTAALRAAELIRQLLAFSGKGREFVSRVDLNVVTAEMALLLSSVVSKKTQLRLAPSAEEAVVHADAGQISQVVMNLIINASESLGDRPGTVTVSTGRRHLDHDFLRRAHADSLPAGDYVYLEVKDDGCGMNAELQAKIFEPFFTTKFTGRGLGLSAVRGVVRGHDGAILVRSGVGEGTTITVLLPRAGEPALVTPVPAPKESPAPRPRGLILVVDDEAPIRSLVGRLLEADGYAVVGASDGLDALEKFRARSAEIDLVLLDMSMPGLSGDQVLDQMRRVDPDVRVVLSSGYAEEQTLARFAGKNLAGFLHKPWTLDELARTIRCALRSRRQ